MKIGILTHHYINNFGAFLQAYALQEALRELFPDDEVCIVNFVNVKHFVINTGGWFRFYINREAASTWFAKIHLPITFQKARKSYLNLSKVCFTAKEIETLGLDFIVVGSDEVWNFREGKGNSKVKFGIGLDKEVLVAYAPSVGQTDQTDLPDYVRTGIKKFRAVSARDDLTEQLAQTIRGEKIHRVLDPTFLVKIPDEPIHAITRPFILFYYCDGLPEKEKRMILEFAREHGMDVYGGGECDKAYTKETVNLRPFQWVWLFRNAQYVVTGTFHGVVFSILNHRRFACYLTNPSRVRKVTSLLQELGLEDRKCGPCGKEIIETMQEEIDYSAVEEKLNERRAESKAFLMQSMAAQTPELV